MEGAWQAKTHKSYAHLLRSIVKLVETKFNLTLNYEHIPGHRGNPGNEIVDALADHATSHDPLHDWNPFFDMFLSKAKLQAAQWLWMLFDEEWSKQLRGTQLAFPAKPSTTPTTAALRLPTTNRAPSQQCQLQLKVATGNVLTLSPQTNPHLIDHVEVGAAGPSRLESLLRQIDEAGIHIFAMQETRLRHFHCKQDPRFLLINSPATQAGHLGIMIGLNRRKCHGSDSTGTEHAFEASHYAIIDATPRRLIVRLCSPILRCIIVGAHAPHQGNDLPVIEEFWRDLTASIPKKYEDWPLILLTDANCRVGQQVDAHIGDWQADDDLEKSHPFQSFVRTHDLWLPATFEGCQFGPSGTWQHARGGWSRIDYVGLPRRWSLTSCMAQVEPNVDLSMQKEDHRMATVDLQFQWTALPHDRRPRIQKVRPNEIDWEAIWESGKRQKVCPEQDIHSHAADLQAHLLEACTSSAQRDNRKPIKATMTPHTWELVKDKREWRNELALRQKHQKALVLHGIFALWKNHRSSECPTEIIATLDAEVRSYDIGIAEALHRFRFLGRQVTVALRRDDKDFFNELAAEAGTLLSPDNAKRFWSVLRKSLPKFRQRRAGIPPIHIERLEDEWEPYFHTLESGYFQTAEQIVQACHHRQTHRPVVQQQYQLADLPTLFELEDEIRLTTADRATGFDILPSTLYHQAASPLATMHYGMTLKSFLWQAEPVCNKGGLLTVIPKRAQASLPKHFRGIMLLPTMAKRTHALLRRKIHQYLEPARLPGQLGGMPHQQVQFGSHALRSFCKTMDALGHSTGIVFIDLATAFHKLVRELVSGIASDTDVNNIVDELMTQGLPGDALRTALRLPPVLERLGAPAFLVELIKDIHCQTWYSLGNPATMSVTRKGTRPGSPLADMIFHLLMHEVLQAFQTWTLAQDEFQQLLRDADCPDSTIAWSDDLAIPWACRDCRDIPRAMEQVLQELDRLFTQRGFQLNYDKGKTSVLVTFRGPGAPAMRKRYQMGDSPGVWMNLHGQVIWVHYLNSYKHLGTLVTSQHTLDAEIAARCGMAWTAFQELSRQVLCNRKLPVATRLRLFQVFVGSKLFFGTGAWTTPSTRQLQKIRGVILRMIKRILHVPPDQPIPLHHLCTITSLGLAEPRARLALERLMYARKVWWRGPSFLQHLLLREDMVVENSWIKGLQADLRWLFDIEPPPDVTWTPGDLTSLIDFWQEGGESWRPFVKKAWRRYGRQEVLLLTAHNQHRAIFKVLTTAGAVFKGLPMSGHAGTQMEEPEHECDRCARVFSSSTGLATHRRQMHGIHSMEHDLLSGTVCPACLKQCWSTARLQQHLAYVSRRTGRNECYQALRLQGYTAPYQYERDPMLSSGLHRVEAIQMEGPIRLPTHPIALEVQKIQQAIQTIEDELADVTEPDLADQKTEEMKQALTQVVRDRQAAFEADSLSERKLLEPLTDDWLAIAISFGDDFHAWSERVLLHWGEHDLPDVLDSLEDGEASYIIDELYGNLAGDLPRYQNRCQRNFLRRRLTSLQESMNRTFEHREPTYGSANAVERRLTAQTIPNLFRDQKQWICSLRETQWVDLPPECAMPLWKTLPSRPCFLVIHLFSGRRRIGDVHDHLRREADRHNFDLIVLSCDTAISPEFGDLQMTGVPWTNILELCRLGKVSAVLCGPPCETFSEARYFLPPDADDDAAEPDKPTRPWPRPLRSKDELFGLPGLKPKEMRQVLQGSQFFLQCIQALAWMLVTGGSFVGEHPWKPLLDWRPSIWTSPIVELLMRHPSVKLWNMPQWHWGCGVPKPTGLLAAHLPMFGSSMFGRRLSGVTRPHAVAIGRDSSGKFRTHDFKEYPAPFCAALAGALMDRFSQCHRTRQTRVSSSEVDAALVNWVENAARACADLNSLAQILPDYQGL